MADTLLKFDINQKEVVDREVLKVVLEASRKAVLQGTADIFQADFFFCYLSFFFFIILVIISSVLIPFSKTLSYQGFRQLLDENTGIFVKMKDLLIGWIQKGFQDFFRSLEAHFLVLSGKTSSLNETEGLIEGKSSEKIQAGLILVLAQLSVFIEQKVIPRITEVTSLTTVVWYKKFKPHL